MFRLALALTFATVSFASCGGSSGAACGPVMKEALDPSSLIHVLPGAPTPTYQTNPPTSGPHQPTPQITGVQTRPIAPQIQVGILEEGHVLLQYKGVTAQERASLNALASGTIIVAPAATLPGSAKVVATAWVTKQTCQSFDRASLKKFSSDQAGNGPGRP